MPAEGGTGLAWRGNTWRRKRKEIKRCTVQGVRNVQVAVLPSAQGGPEGDLKTYTLMKAIGDYWILSLEKSIACY